MKSLTLVFSLMILLFSAQSMASQLPYDGPLLKKQLSPGFAPPEHRVFLACEIYADKLVIREGVDQLQARVEKEIKLDGPIHELIADVQEAPRTEKVGPTDIPTETYSVFANVGAGGIEKIDFSQRGQFIIETESESARLLEKFIDQTCKL